MTTLVVVPPGQPVPANFTPIDLASAMEVVTTCVDEIEKLDGLAMGTNRKEVAQVNRQLLHLADDLALAAALVRNVSWAARGEESFDL